MELLRVSQRLNWTFIDCSVLPEHFKLLMSCLPREGHLVQSVLPPPPLPYTQFSVVCWLLLASLALDTNHFSSLFPIVDRTSLRIPFQVSAAIFIHLFYLRGKDENKHFK